MKRPAFFGVFALLLGFFLGTLCPAGLFPWSVASPFQVDAASASPAQSPANSSAALSTLVTPPPDENSTLDLQNNALLLQAACTVADALAAEDYPALALMVHSELGVTFTPYSTVDLAVDLTFTARQIAALSSNQQLFIWGMTDGRGDPIELTMTDYFRTFVFNADYTRAPQIAVDQIQQGGNALENVADIYPGARFVEFHFPTLSGDTENFDWCSLKTVFLPEGDEWKLIALIHSEWTI